MAQRLTTAVGCNPFVGENKTPQGHAARSRRGEEKVPHGMAPWRDQAKWSGAGGGGVIRMWLIAPIHPRHQDEDVPTSVGTVSGVWNHTTRNKNGVMQHM